jgi:hypothetical protein
MVVGLCHPSFQESFYDAVGRHPSVVVEAAEFQNENTHNAIIS